MDLFVIVAGCICIMAVLLLTDLKSTSKKKHKRDDMILHLGQKPATTEEISQRLTLNDEREKIDALCTVQSEAIVVALNKVEPQWLCGHTGEPCMWIDCAGWQQSRISSDLFFMSNLIGRYEPSNLPPKYGYKSGHATRAGCKTFDKWVEATCES